MTISSNRTLHIKPQLSGTLLLSALVFILALGLGELLLRTPWARALWLVPYPVGGYRVANEYFHRLDDHIAETGKVDCIFLGSSLARVAVNPPVFEEAFQQQAGRRVNCFNFGVSGGTASSIGAIVNILVAKYHPEMVFLVDRPRAFADLPVPNEPEARFPQTPWAQYYQGHFSLQGWVEDVSFVYRTVTIQFPRLLFKRSQEDALGDTDTAADNAGADPYAEVFPDRNAWCPENSVLSRLVQGNTPKLSFRGDAPIHWIRAGVPYERRKLTRLFVLSQDDFNGLKQMVWQDEQGRVRVFVVELPGADDFFLDPAGEPEPTAHQVFSTTLAEYTRAHQVPFWETSDLQLVEPADFSDVRHMYVSGSFIFSRWLGLQVGEAVRRNILQKPVDAALIAAPPLQNLAPEHLYRQTRGLSSPNYQAYQQRLAQFGLVPQDAPILNAFPGALEREKMQTILGFFIEYSETMSDKRRRDYFDLMVLQEKMQSLAEMKLSDAQMKLADQWWSARDASLLRSAGIHYLFYREPWVKGNAAPARSQLEGRPGYALVKTWDYPPLCETYYLYRLE